MWPTVCVVYIIPFRSLFVLFSPYILMSRVGVGAWYRRGIEFNVKSPTPNWWCYVGIYIPPNIINHQFTMIRNIRRTEGVHRRISSYGQLVHNGSKEMIVYINYSSKWKTRIKRRIKVSKVVFLFQFHESGSDLYKSFWYSTVVALLFSSMSIF